MILDLITLTAETVGVHSIVAELERRGISVIDVENAQDIPGADPWKRPLIGGRNTGDVAIEAAPAAPPPETSLIVEAPIRSGQSVLFPRGDVTVIGSVASGAEVLAGGSIHIYGTLRGRAIAGALGTARARIICHRMEAELVSIDGFYKTADDIGAELHGRAVQIWLDGDKIVVESLRQA